MPNSGLILRRTEGLLHPFGHGAHPPHRGWSWFFPNTALALLWSENVSFSSFRGFKSPVPESFSIGAGSPPAHIQFEVLLGNCGSARGNMVELTRVAPGSSTTLRMSCNLGFKISSGRLRFVQDRSWQTVSFRVASYPRNFHNGYHSLNLSPKSPVLHGPIGLGRGLASGATLAGIPARAVQRSVPKSRFSRNVQPQLPFLLSRWYCR